MCVFQHGQGMGPAHAWQTSGNRLQAEGLAARSLYGRSQISIVDPNDDPDKVSCVETGTRGDWRVWIACETQTARALTEASKS